MLGCFSRTKRGTHDSLWSKRKGEKMGKIYRKKGKKQLSLDMLIGARASISQVTWTGGRKETEKMELSQPNRTNQEGP